MNEKNNKLVFLIVILIIMVIGLGGYIIYDKVFIKENKTDLTNNKDQTNDNLEQTKVDKDIEKELLNIIAIDLNNNKDIDLFHLLYDNYQNIKISDLSPDEQSGYIEIYASHNNLLKQVDGSEYELCEAGAGACNAVEEKDLQNIMKKYDFKNSIEEIFPKELRYQSKYLFTNGGYDVEMNEIFHDITSEYDKDDIVLTDKTTLKYEEKETKEEILYRFKTNDKKNYYLYSINAKKIN